MGTVYRRGRVWWLKYKDATGEWTPVSTKAATKAEAKSLLHEMERRVERQRLGLEPISMNPEGWTVADLMRWWLETYSKPSVSHDKNLGSVRRNILATPLADRPLEHVRSGDVEQLLQAMEGKYSASTINHTRQFHVGAFNRAREAGKWLGTNPAELVRTRRGTEQVGDILRPEELGPFIGALEPDQRPVFAAAIFTGLRKGELCGLQKTDVDLERRLLAARRSYTRPFPKSRKQRVVRIPDELAPFLAYALATFPGPWLSPDPDGGSAPRPGSRRTSSAAPSPGPASSQATPTSAGAGAAGTPRTGRTRSCAPARAAASSSGRRGGCGRSASTTSATPTRACCSCRGQRWCRCSGSSATPIRRSPSAGTATCSRTSWRRR